MPPSSAPAAGTGHGWTPTNVATLVTTAALLAASIIVAVLRGGAPVSPLVAPERSAILVPEEPALPTPTVPFRRDTLRNMASSGARSLAMNIAAGNDEVVQAIMSGPRSISTSARCSVRAVVTQLFSSPDRNRAAVTEHRAGVARATADVRPRAVGGYTAPVPEGVTPPYVEEDGRTIDANAIRVSVLLYGCE